MIDKIRLTQVSAALRERAAGTPPTYRQLWHAIVDGKIPGELINGRRWVRHEDLPIIAAAMGMTVTAAPKRRQLKAAAEISA